METNQSTNAILGAGAGVVSTLAMSALMYGAQRAGFTGKLPPKKITQRALERLRAPRSRAADQAATFAGHLSYGSACGAFYNRSLRGRLLKNRPVAEGMLFGGLVWVVSYFGWVPALRIMPPPTKDRPGRSITMLLAHLVFGAVLGKLSPRAAHPQRADAL